MYLVPDLVVLQRHPRHSNIIQGQVLHATSGILPLVLHLEGDVRPLEHWRNTAADVVGD